VSLSTTFRERECSRCVHHITVSWKTSTSSACGHARDTASVRHSHERREIPIVDLTTLAECPSETRRTRGGASA